MRTAEEILKDIIVDVNSMREGPKDFGPFTGTQDRNSDYACTIEWPNLDLLVKEAETALGVKHDS